MIAKKVEVPVKESVEKGWKKAYRDVYLCLSSDALLAAYWRPGLPTTLGILF